MASNLRRRGRTAVRETVLRPQGLITVGNTYGAFPDGALSTADNVLIRSPNRLHSAYAGASSTFVGAGTDIIRRLMPLDRGHVYAFATTTGGVWTPYENGNAAPLPSGLSQTALFKNARIFPTRSRQRMLVNSNRGVLVGDSMTPANSSDRTLRYAGIIQPRVYFGSFTAQAGGPIPSGVTIGYRSIIVRVMSDGYTIKGVPSIPIYVRNNSANDSYAIVVIAFDNSFGVSAGDILELYRTDGLLSTVAGGTDPGPVYKRVRQYVLTNSDVITGAVQLNDIAACKSPFYVTNGVELYTNPGQETELQSNRQPDVCDNTATFKGFTFYGNITERPQLSLRFPAGIWWYDKMDSATHAFNRANAIGTRSGAGTITLGSAVITAVAAADIVGIKQGQRWAPSVAATGFPTSATVSAVGVNTITMSVVATANAATFYLSDVINLIGIDQPIDHLEYFLIFSLSTSFETTVDQPIQFLLNTGAAFTGVLQDTTNISVTLEPIRPCGTSAAAAIQLQVKATNGANYSSNITIPEWTSSVATITGITTKNLFRWSKIDEPEHVPASNEDHVGSAVLISMIATTDALWLMCSDGNYRLSGDGGNWRVDAVNTSCILAAPYAACELNGRIYAYTNLGLAALDDSGIEYISKTLISDLMPGSMYLTFASEPTEQPDIIVCANNTHSEIMVSLGGVSSPVRIFVYSTIYKAFTRLTGDGSFVWLNAACTAISFNSSPITNDANGYPLIAVAPTNPGIQPLYFKWANFGFWMAPVVVFQPFEDSDPMLQKQWVDMSFIFQAADAVKTVNGTISGSALASGFLIADSGSNDSRCTFGITRANSIRPVISPGFNFSSLSSEAVFNGVSLRYVPLTQQQQQRRA